MLNVLQLGIRTQLAQPAESGLQLGKFLQLGHAPIQGGGVLNLSMCPIMILQ